MDRAGCWWWFWCNTATRLSPELCLLHWEMTEAKDIINPFIHTLHFKHTCSHFFTSRLLLNPQEQTLAFSLWLSVSKAHCSIWQQTYEQQRQSVLAYQPFSSRWPVDGIKCVNAAHSITGQRAEHTSACSIHHHCYWSPCNKCVRVSRYCMCVNLCATEQACCCRQWGVVPL